MDELEKLEKVIKLAASWPFVSPGNIQQYGIKFSIDEEGESAVFAATAINICGHRNRGFASGRGATVRQTINDLVENVTAILQQRVEYSQAEVEDRNNELAKDAVYLEAFLNSIKQ